MNVFLHPDPVPPERCPTCPRDMLSDAKGTHLFCPECGHQEFPKLNEPVEDDDGQR